MAAAQSHAVGMPSLRATNPRQTRPTAPPSVNAIERTESTVARCGRVGVLVHPAPAARLAEAASDLLQEKGERARGRRPSPDAAAASVAARQSATMASDALARAAPVERGTSALPATLARLSSTQTQPITHRPSLRQRPAGAAATSERRARRRTRSTQREQAEAAQSSGDGAHGRRAAARERRGQRRPLSAIDTRPGALAHEQRAAARRSEQEAGRCRAATASAMPIVARWPPSRPLTIIEQARPASGRGRRTGRTGRWSPSLAHAVDRPGVEGAGGERRADRVDELGEQELARRCRRTSRARRPRARTTQLRRNETLRPNTSATAPVGTSNRNAVIR